MLGLFWLAGAQAQESPLVAQAAWMESGQALGIEQVSTRFAGLFKPA